MIRSNIQFWKVQKKEESLQELQKELCTVPCHKFCHELALSGATFQIRVLGHSTHACSCKKYGHCQRKKVKKDKKRAQEQYETFNKLESVGYYLDREKISSYTSESWTSNQEILCCENFSW